MSTVGRQTFGLVDNQQPVQGSEENPRIYALLNNVPIFSNSQSLHEQQIIYYSNPLNYQHLTNNPQHYVYPQQLSNNQIVNHYTTSSTVPRQTRPLKNRVRNS
jgi:hypothetical protein